MELIQSFVDRTCDVQTAAILCCFCNSAAIQGDNAVSAGAVAPLGTAAPGTAGTAVSTRADDIRLQCEQWQLHYKIMLNQWKLWHLRALFDVNKALLSNAIQTAVAACAHSGALPHSPHRASTISPSSNSALSQEKKKASLSIRPQVYARCNYCGQSLSMEGMGGAGAKSQAR